MAHSPRNLNLKQEAFCEHGVLGTLNVSSSDGSSRVGCRKRKHYVWDTLFFLLMYCSNERFWTKVKLCCLVSVCQSWEQFWHSDVALSVLSTTSLSAALAKGQCHLPQVQNLTQLMMPWLSAVNSTEKISSIFGRYLTQKSAWKLAPLLSLSQELCVLVQNSESLVWVLQGLLKEMMILRGVSLQNCVSDTSDDKCRRNAWRWLMLHYAKFCLVPGDAVSQ